MKMKTIRNKERGSALLVALILLGVLTMVGVSVTLTSTSQLKISANSQDLEDTFWATNAGANLVLSNTSASPESTVAYLSDITLDAKAQSLSEQSASDTFLQDVYSKVKTNPVYGNNGKALDVSIQQQGKGTSCPRAEKGSSVTKIACDHFVISSKIDLAGNYDPAVKLGIYREMIHNNSATHQTTQVD